MYSIKAIAEFLPNSSGITGTIRFEQVHGKGYTTITGFIYGLEPGLHGFHIHTEGEKVLSKQYTSKGNCCDLLGGHYNPFHRDHGYPIDEERHVGDLGNVLADRKGVAEIRLKDPLIKLNGVYSVIGRSLIVHANTDDGGEGDTPESKITGNSGPRLACAIIKEWC